MKTLPLLFILSLLSSLPLKGQYNYEPSAQNPFGKLNPAAPLALNDYEVIIGLCDCLSKRRLPDGTWAAAEKMTWEFKYIMNGMAIQDQTLKADGIHSGSIRQYNVDSAKWFVHYYTTAAAKPTLSSWSGGMVEKDIILYKPQQAPNGTAGYFRISFTAISKEGFNWLGEWVSLDESILFPTWEISCIKRKSND